MTEDVLLSRIKDPGSQMRVEATNPDIINEYAEAMLNGDVFPPVIVYFDDTDYWLGEGFHRTGAVRKIERESITADVRKGTARDAILHGVGANATHGLRRTHADKRRAVERLLTDPEWAQWSDNKISKVANVDHKTVSKIRRELAGEIPTGKSVGISQLSKPNGSVGRVSLVESVLGTLSDEVLIAECQRRGLVVEASFNV